MLPLLWDETFPLVCTSIGPDDRGDGETRCSAPLAQRDDLTLVCSDERCATEYRIRDGIPVLVSHERPAPRAEYDDELLAQMYAEMHFATFRTDLDTVEEPVEELHRDPRPAPYWDPGRDVGDPIALGRLLFATSDLTGPFYSAMAEIVLAHSRSPHGLVADIACGMARMAFELDTHGWAGRYLGVDLSPRLLTDARQAFGGEEVVVRMAADLGRGPRSRVVPIQAPKLDSERSLLAVGDAGRLALATQSCDAVLGFNLVDRVADPAKTVKELWRCVAPDGILVLADPFEWQDQLPDKRIYSFDAVAAWLDDAEQLPLPAHHRSVIYAHHRRDSRAVVIYDDAVAVFRRAC